MAIIGISKTEEERIYHPGDENEPEEKRTYFVVGAVDLDTRIKLMDRQQVQEMTAEGNYRLVSRGYETNADWCRAGLKGWTNFKDEHGKDIPCHIIQGALFGKPMSVLSDESLAFIPPHIVSWIGQEIMTRNTATEAFRKKLKALSSPSNSSLSTTA